MGLYVDRRWLGDHGIARFATEVTTRFSLDAQKLCGARPFGISAQLQSARISSHHHIYSPGFNAGITGARQLLTIHDLIHLDAHDERSVAKSLYYRLVVKPAIVRAGIVHTVSEYSRSRITAWLGTEDVEIINVGNGVSPNFFTLSPRAEVAPAMFLYVGNLKPHKNALVLLRALKIRPYFRILFVTRDAALLRKWAIEIGVESQVKIQERVTDESLAALYRSCSGLLFPSLIEGFGFPALEATVSGARVAYSSGCLATSEVLAGSGLAVSDFLSGEGWALAMDDLLQFKFPDQKIIDTLRAKHSWDIVSTHVQKSILKWRKA